MPVTIVIFFPVYRGRMVRKKYGNMLNKREKKAIVIQAGRGNVVTMILQTLHFISFHFISFLI